MESSRYMDPMDRKGPALTWAAHVYHLKPPVSMLEGKVIYRKGIHKIGEHRLNHVDGKR